jgi:hypothetical protein
MKILFGASDLIAELESLRGVAEQYRRKTKSRSAAQFYAGEMAGYNAVLQMLRTADLRPASERAAFEAQLETMAKRVRS